MISSQCYYKSSCLNRYYSMILIRSHYLVSFFHHKSTFLQAMMKLCKRIEKMFKFYEFSQKKLLIKWKMIDWIKGISFGPLGLHIHQKIWWFKKSSLPSGDDVRFMKKINVAALKMRKNQIIIWLWKPHSLCRS